MSLQSSARAQHFINCEKQFHLGFLPTEQSCPQTRYLDKEFARGSVFGVANLQSVDRNVLDMAERVLASEQFKYLVDTGEKVLRSGGRIVFSGCGATGRLSILLESMYRDCCMRYPQMKPYSDQVFSIMTGGDYALVRSVEFFEDYQSFGRQQVKELAMNEADMLVAITEGGETSSVLGTVFEALERKSEVFLMFNNPAEILTAKLERSKKAIEDPRVHVLDLFCGPMALAGSTRMQATTSEQLIAGGALESMVNRLLGRPELDYAELFKQLLDDLENPAAQSAMADYIDFEADIYSHKGLLTYLADDYLLDIFTDTTERSPTFMLPPFRKCDDSISPRPWSFVKNPLHPTAEVWQYSMNRPLRCLEWDSDLYMSMGAPEKVLTAPPRINKTELLKFQVGNENWCDRLSGSNDAAVLITMSNGRTNAELLRTLDVLPEEFKIRRQLAVGEKNTGDWHVYCHLPDAPLQLISHMAIKLVLNTVSTGIMARLGRISGNWMSYVDVSNKKLIDRAIRLISEIGQVTYERACEELFAAVEELEQNTPVSSERVSTVQYVLKKLSV